MDWYTQLFLPHACLGPATLGKTARHNPLSDSIFVFLLAAAIMDMLCLSFMALLVPLPSPTICIHVQAAGAGIHVHFLTAACPVPRAVPGAELANLF